MVHAEDQEWLFRVLTAGWQLRSHSELTVSYRTSPGGLSANVARMFEGWQCFIEHARAVQPKLVEAHLADATASMHLYYARRLMRDGRFGTETFAHASRSLLVSPKAFGKRPFAFLVTAASATLGLVSPTLANALITLSGKLRHA